MSALIIGYARTPFVRFNGKFSNISAVKLGAASTRAALLRSGVNAADVDFLFAGQVLQTAAGQNPARQTSILAGIPSTTPAQTLNAVCLSGLEAISAGVRMIESGEADIVVAVGQESMSQAPRALANSRLGTKYGAMELIDTLEIDGLTDAFENRSMGAATEDAIQSLNISRADQDHVAEGSHRRLAQSLEFQAEEITPIEIAQGREMLSISSDDGLRVETTLETLGALKAAFDQEGTITAGNSSQITDGAATVILMSEKEAKARGIRGIARVLATALVAGPDFSLAAQPANAINAVLSKSSKTSSDLVAAEINEAFAAVAVHSTRLLNLDPEIVNSNGGAIALGHPIGASGARIVGHLARRLQALGSGAIGAAGICGGGGQGSAILLEAI
jgi:acetyl-CoA C-acetyltransferase